MNHLDQITFQHDGAASAGLGRFGAEVNHVRPMSSRKRAQTV
jgi:hypothetical protein